MGDARGDTRLRLERCGGQVQRPEQPGREDLAEVVAGEAFDQQAEHVVAGVGVVPPDAGGEAARRRIGEADLLAGRDGAGGPGLLDGRQVRVIRKAAGVVEQLPHRDPGAVAEQAGQVSRDRVVQAEPALGGQLQRHGGDVGLGDTGDAEPVRGPHRCLPVQVGEPFRPGP